MSPTPKKQNRLIFLKNFLKGKNQKSFEKFFQKNSIRVKIFNLGWTSGSNQRKKRLLQADMKTRCGNRQTFEKIGSDPPK